MVKEHINKIVTIILIIIFFVFGTLFYSNIEGWSYIDSFYFTGMTLTTVGYGDFIPTTDLSKIVTVFFTLAGVGVFLYALTAIAGSYLERKQKTIVNKKAEEKSDKKLQKAINKKIKLDVHVKKKSA